MKIPQWVLLRESIIVNQVVRGADIFTDHARCAVVGHQFKVRDSDAWIFEWCQHGVVRSRPVLGNAAG